MPIYLLSNRNFTAFKHCSLTNLVNGNLLIGLAHWTIFEAINVAFGVNINFFLCPTPGISAIFDVLPSFIVWPSYRTPMSIVIFIVALILSYIYVAFVAVLYYVTGYASRLSDKKKNGTKEQ